MEPMGKPEALQEPSLLDAPLAEGSAVEPQAPNSTTPASFGVYG